MGTHVRTALALAAIVGMGFWVRTLPVARGVPALTGWRPWTAGPIVTVYFADGPRFFPVSRRVHDSANLARTALDAVLDGPPAGSGLPPMAAAARVAAFEVSDGVARVDLAYDGPTSETAVQQARASISETLVRLPGVRAVSVAVAGTAVTPPSARHPLLYFASARGLAAVPTQASTPREAVDRYLAGAPDSLIGMPRDVRLINYGFDADDGVISVDFTYTPSVRALAIEKPDIMRFVLLGLVTTLTEFPDVRAVRMDFQGHSQLGLGQCSDLLRTAQPRPRLLNDERLLRS